MNVIVSIITPVYNAERFVAKTITSVLAQSYTHWEMILVDDCSTDASASVVAAFAEKDPRITLIRLPINAGVVTARNKGIELAKGGFIAFLDSDDQWAPEKLEKQMQELNNGANLSYTNFIKIDTEENVISRKNIIKNTGRTLTYQSLLRTNSIPNSSAIYNCRELGKLYYKYGGKLRNGKNVIHEDYIYWLMLFESGKVRPAFIDEPLLIYRVHNTSLSNSKITAALSQWSIYRNHLKLGWFRSAFFFSSYFINGIMKSIK